MPCYNNNYKVISYFRTSTKQTIEQNCPVQVHAYGNTLLKLYSCAQTERKERKALEEIYTVLSLGSQYQVFI